MASWYRAAAALGVLLTGCSLNEVAVNTTANVLVEAQDTTVGYFDWESAGMAAASGIMQLEGLHRISPDNEELTLMLVKAYMAFAYGWVMDAHEVAKSQGEMALAEHHQQRAHLMYSRARDLSMRMLRSREEHFEAMTHESPKVLHAYLADEFDDAEDDIAPLYWLMMSWSAAVNNSPSSADFVDMPSIRTIAEWIEALDPSYEDGGTLVFLGGFDASYPQQIGGNPAKGKAYFERALALTQRKHQIYLVNYAMLYAVNVRDRALFESLLHEVIDAGDAGPKYRLPNKVAKRRALRYLARVTELLD